MANVGQSSLQRIDGYPFPVFCSSGARQQAATYARLLEAAHTFLNEALEFTPELQLFTLAPEDWAEHADFPVYGLPHTAREKDIVVGTELGEFWDPIIQLIEDTSTPEQRTELLRIHAPANGKLDASALNDLLSVHELGHLYHQQVPFEFPRLWLMELFANLCVHVYVDVLEPDRMPGWTSLCERLSAAPPDVFQHQSLEDFEQLYAGVGAENYVWYQFRLITGITDIHQSGDTGLLQRLYRFGQSAPDLTDDQLAGQLEEHVHPGLADLMRTWPG